MDKKVLVVDDSAFLREILSDIINNIDGFTVIGTAADPHIAAEKIMKLQPDIITLDIEMPKMDGLTFLEKIMRLKPIPVLIISTLVAGKSSLGLKALELGAVDYVAKPTESLKDSLADLTSEIKRKLQACAITKVQRRTASREDLDKKYDNTTTKSKAINFSTTDKVIAIGSSTGGTVVLSKILKELPVNMPGIVIVQHMPAGFTNEFAKSLDRESQLFVKQAEHGDSILSGQVLIAPGGFHMVVRRSGTKFFVELNEEAPVTYSRPSVDVLFNSVAETMGKNSASFILTGMGHDGADGMLNMKNAGAKTYAQDEKSCTVYGMPKSAIEKGGVEEIHDIEGIIEILKSYAI
jgi:two-component system chemotaxis response regulator CheB